ncbi:hypothetical protein E5F05_12830 [Deinococcus metallilatus]|uniref:Intracellular proteinase inhibitor BsuPI domain-containing protein n=2 Tax=Deinococcus metallilatus TaxID=1211322 RepID=A0AAJ5JYD3_9DEIO|nr:hypothetical protein E5F05_12830 [Deinococcus metallilatus]RXJ10622.1 hypothetical protein ERJ73_11660 [Deinococcus metallilatus]TLK26593.1 hypothetical protein FCS05_11410 [Deinococcus metallilatus]
MTARYARCMFCRVLALLVLPALLGSCALLGGLPGPDPHESPPGPGPAAAVFPQSIPPLTAQAEAAATGREVTVALTVQNGSGQPLLLRYAAQVNWGSCGLPPYVALARLDGTAVAAPTSAGRLTCPELQFSRILAPGETLTLKRTLPPLPPGTYTLTGWFDGEAGGEPLRVQAGPVVVEVK